MKTIEKKRVQPQRQFRPEGAHPMNLLKKIAESYACKVFGEGAVGGAPLPIRNEEGQAVLYAFPFAKNLRKFPGPKALARKFARSKALYMDDIGVGTDPKREAQSIFGAYWEAIRPELARFGTIYVSASRESYPVPSISHGLHPYFYNIEPALRAASTRYGMSRPKFLGLRIHPPCYEYFEIGDGRRSILLQVGSLISEKEIRSAAAEFQLEVDFPELGRREIDKRTKDIELAWAAFDGADKDSPVFNPERPEMDNLAFPYFGDYEFLIPNHERVPAILWTRWCAPTAASMVIAHWDRYVPLPGVGTGAYERIVDYWHDHPSNGNNVPNLLDEIIDSPTYDHFANVLNGYNWSFKTKIGYPQDDWAWNDLLAELHAGRPVRWQIYPPGTVPGHAVCVFGYRRVFLPGINEKYVILYDTWSKTKQEWHYNHYTWGGGGVANWIELNAYIPGGMEYNRSLYIRYPFGGEVYQAGKKNEIRFYAQSDIKIAKIEYSRDGGNTWSPVAEMAVKFGWNSYGWRFPTTPTSRGRIRIKGLSAKRIYLAGDGSYENFTLL